MALEQNKIIYGALKHTSTGLTQYNMKKDSHSQIS